MSEFYVYCLFRLDGRPCYIGKGQGRRAKYHFYPSQQRNPHLAAIIKSAGGHLPYTLLHEGLEEKTALDYEMAFISAIGRKAHGGPLANMTDGGEGMSGLDTTQETRAKRSKAMKTIWAKPEHREKMLDGASERTREFWADPDRRQCIAASLRTPEHRAKQSAASKARWADPEYRARVTEKVGEGVRRAAAAGKLDGRTHSAESKEKIGAATVKLWADPEERARLLAQRAELQARKDEQDRLAKGLSEKEWSAIEKKRAYWRSRKRLAKIQP